MLWGEFYIYILKAFTTIMGTQASIAGFNDRHGTAAPKHN
jgi:hypothetical protein